MPRIPGTAECCYDDAGRLRLEHMLVEAPPPGAPPGLIVRRCTVCARRHRELAVDPGEFGIVGTHI